MVFVAVACYGHARGTGNAHLFISIAKFSHRCERYLLGETQPVQWPSRPKRHLLI